MQGEKGDKGEKGDTGKKGSKGETGPKGINFSPSEAERMVSEVILEQMESHSNKNYFDNNKVLPSFLGIKNLNGKETCLKEVFILKKFSFKKF